MTSNQIDEKWLIYLSQLSLPYADFIRDFWKKLSLSFPNLPIPRAWSGEDDSPFFFIWDDGNSILEIELHSNNMFDWFYRNRTTDWYDGTEDSVSIIDEWLRYYLSNVKS